IHVGAEWNHGKRVERYAEKAALLLADAYDSEMHALDLNGLVERVDVAEQSGSGVGSKEDDRPVAVDLDATHHPAPLGVEVREVEILRRHALDLGVVEYLSAVRDRR